MRLIRINYSFIIHLTSYFFTFVDIIQNLCLIHPSYLLSLTLVVLNVTKADCLNLNFGIFSTFHKCTSIVRVVTFVTR